MWHHLKPLALCAATLTLAAGCAHRAGEATSPGPAAEPAPVAKAAGAAPAVNFNKGSVTEIIQAGRYSYINVDSGGAKTWFAVPYADLKIGDKVEVQPGMPLKDYYAKSLNRTFESITFSDGMSILGPAKAPAGKLPSDHPAIGGADKIAVKGKVVEFIKGADFNYVCVDDGDAKTWLTVPAATTVTAGQELRFLPGKEMKNFTSNKLNRTFDRIIFSGGIDKESR